jgi:hypothetical protein
LHDRAGLKSWPLVDSLMPPPADFGYAGLRHLIRAVPEHPRRERLRPRLKLKSGLKS